ncbi:MAG TPA: GNAT family N-acetyltransferase [Dongiaceae bacterium]|nr:GNAT family N-acetyltransferase [Dongiaceae bacterium]
MAFVPTSALSGSDIADVRRIVAGHPVFALYFETALDALANGLDNRSALIGGARQGAILSIDFDGLTIRTTIGALTPAELALAPQTDRRAELHLAPAHLATVRRRCAARIEATRTLRYYRLDTTTDLIADPRCRRLGPADLVMVTDFYRRHYPATVFSRWMLDEAFLGLFADGELLACGGVISRNARLAAANVGNFLTHPAHRRRGLGRALVASLVELLAGDGVRRFLLGANADNIGACRAYEAVGFRLIEARPQLDLAAA